MPSSLQPANLNDVGRRKLPHGCSFVALVIGTSLHLTLSFIAKPLFAQVDSVWTGIYGQRGGTDEFGKLIQTSDSGYMIGGWSSTPGRGEEFRLVKVDSSGVEQWMSSYQWVEQGNRLFGIAQTLDGGYVMSGMVASDSSSAWLAKTDSAGDLLWAYQYGETATKLRDVIIDRDGQIMAVGNDHSDFWLLKVDNDGTVIEEHYYGGRGYDEPYRFIQTSDGGSIIVGVSSSFGGIQAFAVKVDSAGNEEWHQDYGGDLADAFDGVQELSGGYFLFCGMSRIDNNNSYEDSYAVETDSLGNVVWSRTYYRFGGDRFEDVIAAPQGGFLFVGQMSSNLHESGYLALRVDMQGEVQWELNVGHYMSGQFNCGLLMEDGGCLLGGLNEGPANDKDYWLVRTTPDTLLPMELEPILSERDYGDVWLDSLANWCLQVRNPSRRYTVIDSISFEDSLGGFSCDFDSIIRIPDGDTVSFSVGFRPHLDTLYQAGLYLWYGGDSVQISLTGNGYDLDVPTDPPAHPIAANLKSYPNPFNSQVTIKYQLLKPGKVRLSIFDLSEREVVVLAACEQLAGSYQFTWNSEHFASGLYFARLETSDYKQVNKMTLVK